MPRKAAKKSIAKIKLTQAQQLQSLYRLCELFSGPASISDASIAAVEELSKVTKMPVVAIEFFDEDAQSMILKAVHGIDALADFSTSADQTHSGIPLRSREPHIDIASNAGDSSISLLRRDGFLSYAGFPFILRNRCLGTLSFASSAQVQFDDSFQPWAVAAAGIIAAGAGTHTMQSLLHSAREENEKLLKDNATQREEFDQARRSQPGLDSATFMPNSALFRFLFYQAVARARRGKQILALLYMDIDHFNEIRQNYGEEGAKHVVRQVADRLKRNCRDGDTVARLGEDEFVWSISNVQAIEDIAVVAEKALAMVARPVNLAGREINVTASVGISVFPYDGGEAEGLVGHSETALARAKGLGRNMFQFYTEMLNTRVVEELAFKRRLREAVERSEFILHYQPVLNTSDRTVEGVEALLRWQNPEGRLALPGEFMAASQRAGLMNHLDEWVIAKACEQVRSFHSIDGRPLRVTVNLSSHLFEAHDLPWKLSVILRQTGLRPDLLELDIPQSVLMRDTAKAAEIMQRCKQLGVRISIDDFGAGLIDLGCLRELPCDALKIDASYTRDITGASSSAVVAGIISLAHSLKKSVVAKGVENEAQLDRLREMQCDGFQGYLISAPVPAVQVPDLLKTFRPLVAESKVASVEPPVEIEHERHAILAPTPSERAGAKNAISPMAKIYWVTCFHCASIFNAVDAPWCSCLVTEQTLICPHCFECFCKTPVKFKLDFWSEAPQVMWDKRTKEEQEDAPLPVNPHPDHATHPLVLVVDDEIPILHVAARALKERGYGAIVALNGEQGLELARRYFPELVLTDAIMPRLDGREMCRMIKLDPRLSKVKVVIVTSLDAGTKERSAAIRDYKTDDFLQKPLSHKQLDELLARFIKKPAQ